METVNGVVCWACGSGAGGGAGGGWVVLQWSLKARRDRKNIFGLDGQEVWQQVKMPVAVHLE